MARKRIGELLVERGAISAQQLEQGLERHRQTRQRLGVALVGLGFISEETLVQVLAEALSMPVVDLKTLQPEWTAIHMLRARFCELHDLFPYALEQVGGKKALCVAMSDPLNQPALDEIEFTTGLKISPRLSSLSQIRTAILRYYHKVTPADPGARGMTVVQRGGQTLEVPEPDTKPDNDADNEPDEVIVGEELAPEPARRVPPKLVPTATPATRAAARPASPPAATPAPKASPAIASLSADLDYLFGDREEPDPAEDLERKFWALLRLMQKKGLITPEEFKDELGRDEEG